MFEIENAGRPIGLSALLRRKLSSTAVIRPSTSLFTICILPSRLVETFSVLMYEIEVEQRKLSLSSDDIVYYAGLNKYTKL